MSHPTRDVIQQRRVAEAEERLGGNWRDHKACGPEHWDLFWPESHAPHPPDYGPALAVCQGCSVQRQCEAWGVAAGEIVDGHTLHGQVLAGRVPKERKPGKKRSNGAPIPHGTRAGYEKHRRQHERPCPECVEAQKARDKARRAS